MAHAAHWTLALAVALCGGWLSLAAAQARERVAFVSVVAKDHATPLAALEPADIVVREDGVVREVLRVAPASGPMAIAVLVDNSAAAESALADLRSAVTAFIDGLGGLGPVAIVSMAERPTIVTDYASVPEALRAGTLRLFSRPDSGATVGEAVLDVARGLLKRSEERAAIVVVSVGGVEHSEFLAAHVVSQLTRASATLHVVALSPTGQARFDDATRQRDTLFDRGVRESGGTRRDVLTTMSLPSALADVARVLTHQFRVVYARPQTLIPPDRFEVAAARPGFTAHGTTARGQPK